MNTLNGDMLYEIQKMLSVKEWGVWRCVSKRCLSSTLKDTVSRKFTRVLKEFHDEAASRDVEVHRCQSERRCTYKMSWFFMHSAMHYYQEITRDKIKTYIIHSIEVRSPQLAYKGAYYYTLQDRWKLPDIEDLFTHLE